MKYTDPLGFLSSRKETAPFFVKDLKLHTKHQGFQEKWQFIHMEEIDTI